MPGAWCSFIVIKLIVYYPKAGLPTTYYSIGVYPLGYYPMRGHSTRDHPTVKSTMYCTG